MPDWRRLIGPVSDHSHHDRSDEAERDDRREDGQSHFKFHL
jgi:hypothetical protein